MAKNYKVRVDIISGRKYYEVLRRHRDCVSGEYRFFEDGQYSTYADAVRCSKHYTSEPVPTSHMNRHCTH